MNLLECSFKVRIPPELRELVPEFFENRKKDVITLKNDLEEGDFKAIASLAHRMKGNGGGYGFPVISEIGGHLERVALGIEGEKKQMASCIESLIASLDEYIQKVDVEYDEG